MTIRSYEYKKIPADILMRDDQKLMQMVIDYYKATGVVKRPYIVKHDVIFNGEYIGTVWRHTSPVYGIRRGYARGTI